MTSNIAVSAENVSKRYRIGEFDKSEDNLLKAMVQTLKKPIANYKKYRSFYEFDEVKKDGVEPANVLWALRDVGFEVPQGQVMGIVGSNGAGKSTLLKVLTGITPPTTGRIKIRGRVSSLLEVGTGFHPELTGRENVFLNGTMLGMRKAEVAKKFDEIVDFSGVEKFLDTPVKRYSSGMRVRLAFAVAAHLEPEVLIIDEVLAVGDASFQRKCLNKMEHSGKEGRTVLFVSHNLPAVTQLCTRAILLQQGKVVLDDTASEVVAAYLRDTDREVSFLNWSGEDAPGDEVVRLRSVRVKTDQGESSDSLDLRYPIGLEMQYEVQESGYHFLPHFIVVNDQGLTVFTTLETDPEWESKARTPGFYTTTAWVPGNLMSAGKYFLAPVMASLDPFKNHFYEPEAISFHIDESFEPGGARGIYTGKMDGVFRPKLDWETQYSNKL